MGKSNFGLVSCIIVLAILVGIVAGAATGGVAGFYAAQSAVKTVAVDASQIQTRSTAVPVTVVPTSPPSTSSVTTVTMKEESAIIDSVRKVKPAVVTVINQLQSRRGVFGGSLNPTASGSGVI